MPPTRRRGVTGATRGRHMRAALSRESDVEGRGTMMLRLRVEVADRPGSLARLAGVLAAFRGDVTQVTVMHRADGVAVDDVWMTVASAAPAVEIYAAISQLPGTRLLGWRAAAAPVEFDAQLDFLAYLFAAPQRGLEAFVDMLPAVVDADWAAVRPTGGAIAYHSEDGEGHGPSGPSAGHAVAELPVADGVSVLVGRRDELTWHPVEVRRMASVMELATLFIKNCAGSTPLPMTSLTQWFVDTPVLATA